MSDLKKKQVTFNPKIESRHYFFTWLYASRRARIDETFQQDARDRERFRLRIERTANMLNAMLTKKMSQGPLRGTR